MNVERRSVLIVGAGFAGAVYARCLAEADVRVHVIDKRSHIAGNAFDETGPDGIRVHRYGPHLFHTANERVLAWVQKYAHWTSFTHRVRAQLPSGVLTAMPINLDTINAVFGTAFSTSDQGKEHLKKIAIPVANPSNAAEYLGSRIGTLLTDLFFRPYTKKMWGVNLEDLSASVIKRIPLRTDQTDTYFPTSDTQIMPNLGYTSFFKNLLDHPLIKVSLDTSFDQAMLSDVRYCFASMPIDEFYNFREGELPYRSIRFHHRSVEIDKVEAPWSPFVLPYSVINYTDSSPYTRETAWHLMPNHLEHETYRRTFTREEPCDYRDNFMERYYPVKTADGLNEKIYRRYTCLSELDASRISFIGRCGTYQYLDMDQVINQSLTGAEKWLQANRC
ncbi:UDP-galactopyranose mutase [Beijerinckia sp. L45]|uniref:UDP-galactopyranose mutase n=1 Tax=Beijerinckia sp. L45 TaxID=1641855 RepID=UPI00131BD2E6|nr:UDP-galactopyranose mutase [Beijerinckia sp. L45]